MCSIKAQRQSNGGYAGFRQSNDVYAVEKQLQQKARSEAQKVCQDSFIKWHRS